MMSVIRQFVIGIAKKKKNNQYFDCKILKVEPVIAGTTQSEKITDFEIFCVCAMFFWILYAQRNFF